MIAFFCHFPDHHKKEVLTTTEKMSKVKKRLDLLVNPEQVEAKQKDEMQRMQRMLEETLTKNMHLTQDMENMAKEVVRLSKNQKDYPPPKAE